MKDHETSKAGVPICRVCGKEFKRIGKHIASSHNMSMVEYEMIPPWPGIKELKGAKLSVSDDVSSLDTRFAEAERYLAFGVGRVLSFAKTPTGADDISKEIWNEEERNYIPDLDPTFIPNPAIMEMLALGTQMSIPTYCYGPTGSGKTSHIWHLAALTRTPIRRINLHGDTRASDLMGTREVITDDDGNSITTFTPGVVTQCMINGWWLLLDELDCAKTGIAMVLQSILERSQGKKQVYVPNYGLVDIHPLFRIFGTGNTNGRGEFMELYPGTQVLNEAFMDRFALATYVPYNWNVIREALPKRVVGCGPYIDTMLKVAQEIQKAFEGEDCYFTLSPRKVFTWAEVAKLYEGGYGKKAVHIAANNVIMSKLGNDDRAFFNEIYQRITGYSLMTNEDR